MFKFAQMCLIAYSHSTKLKDGKKEQRKFALERAS